MARILQIVPLMIITGAVLLIAVLFGRAFVTLYGLLQQVIKSLGIEKPVDYALVTLLILGIVVLLFLVTRWLVATRTKQSEVTSALGSQSVLVYLNGGWQPALLIERTATGAYVVYVPHAPTARSGTIYVVESFQVSPLNIPIGKMEEIIRHAGKGLSDHAGKLFETG